MACPGGCVAGAGTLQSVSKSKKAVEQFASQADYTCATETQHLEYLPLIRE
jgi:iron only hydrogenase large subunit-like protein